MNAKLKLSCALIVSLCISLICIAGTALVVSSEDVHPDIVVTGITTPESFYPDYMYTIGATVENIGECNITTPFNVSLKADETVIDNETVNALLAGENWTVVFSWTPLSTGFYNLTAVADHENAISESDETNNTCTKNITVIKDPKPDLIVTEIQMPQRMYTSIRNTITATVGNIGNVNTSTPFKVRFVLNDTILCEKTVTTVLATAANTSISFDWTPAHAGSYTVNMTADSDDEIIELDETNNTKSLNVTAFLISETELNITEVKTTDTICVGELNPVRVLVKNLGMDAGEFDVTLHANGAHVGTKRVPSLAFNTVTVVGFGWVPDGAGSYTLNATESETNNRMEADVSVAPVPVWNHTANITIAHSGTLLTGHQILLTLDPSIFDYNLTGDDGRDIAFRDGSKDGDPLPYWVAEWNTSGESRIRIRLNVPPEGKTITMLYGNSSVSSGSDGYLVFDFYDDFEAGLDGWQRDAVLYGDGDYVITIVGDAGSLDGSDHAARIEIKRLTGIAGLYRNMTLLTPYYFDFGMMVECDTGTPEAGVFVGARLAYDVPKLYATEEESPWASHSIDLSNWTGQTVGIGFYGMNSWWGDYHVNISIDNARLRNMTDPEPFVDYGYADIVPITITSRFANLYANFTNQIYVTVVNDGTADARNFSVFLNATYEWGGTSSLVKRITLTHKNRTTLEFLWNPPHEGNYTLEVVSDTEEIVDETDETNNTITLDVYVNPPLKFGYAFKEDVLIAYHGANLTDSSVMVTLDPSIFEYEKALPDGSDVRLKDENSTELPYWIEEWNITGESKLWVKLDIPDGGRGVYLCYGNPVMVDGGDYGAKIGLLEDWEVDTVGDWTHDTDGTKDWGTGRGIVDTIAHGGAYSLRLYANTGYTDTGGVYSYNRLYRNISIRGDPIFSGWFKPYKFAGQDIAAMYMLSVNLSNTTYHLCYGAFDHVPEDSSDTFYFDPLIGADRRWHHWHRNIRNDLVDKGVTVTGEIEVTTITLYNRAQAVSGLSDEVIAYYDEIEIWNNPAIVDLGYADLVPTDIAPKIGRFYANYTRNPVVVTVENTGTADARDFNISLLINNELVGTKTGFVPHRANRSFEFNWTPPNAGEYTMDAEVDEIDVVNETDEENNNLTIGIAVNPDVSWTYNDAIPVQYAGEDLKNASVLIVLDPSIFDYSKAQNDGGDIRFEDANGNPPPYWIEKWNRTGESRIWVRLDVPDGGTEVQMLYGCEDVRSEDDPSGVVTLFENWDCEGMNGWVDGGGGGVTTVDVSDQTRRMYSMMTSSDYFASTSNGIYKDIMINSSAPFFSGWMMVEKLDSSDACAMYVLDLNVSGKIYHLCYGIFNNIPSDTGDTLYHDPIVWLDGDWHWWHRSIKADLESKGITTTGGIEVIRVTHNIKDPGTGIRRGNEISAYFADLAIISSHSNITAGSAELAPIRIAPRLNRTYIDYPNEILVDIRNNGTADARDFNVTLYEAGKIIDTERIPLIRHKSEMAVEFVWKPESTGNHTLRVEADPRNMVEELNEENNNLTIGLCVVVKDMPDLTIRNLTTPDEIRLNCSIGIETTIENLGTSLGEFNLSLCVDEMPIENRTLNALQSGENTTINFTWIPDDTGDRTLTITLDPDNEIEELNEENNDETQEMIVVAPDLTLEVNRQPHYYLNHSNVINVSVTNNGTASSEGFNVSFYVDNSTKEEKRIETLDRDKTETLSFDWEPSELGNHILAIEVDRDYEICESNESNNNLMMEVCAIELPESDIAITNVTTKKRFYANTANMITVRVKNEGTQIESFNVTLSEDGAPVVVQRIDNLTAHTETSVRFAWVPREIEENLPKNCTLVIEADSGGEVNESDETNNERTLENVTLEYIAVPPSPALIRGNASYQDGTSCTDFSATITKRNETFAARTVPEFSYYNAILLLYPNDTYPGPCMIRVTATDGGSVNVTDHNMTAEEVGMGEVVLNVTIPFLLPDINVTRIDLPEQCYINRTYTINTTIKNIGTDMNLNQSFNVSFLVDGVAVGVKTIGSLNYRETAELSFEWTPDRAGSYDLTIFADSDQEITEAAEYNNNLTVTGASAIAPDLVIEGILINGIEPPYDDIFVNRSNTIDITINNTGTADVDLNAMFGEYFSITLLATKGDATATIMGSVSQLNESESKVVSLSWTPAETGDYTLRAVVDSGGVIDESNETNNEFAMNRSVCEPADLRMVLVSGERNEYFRSFTAPLNCTAYNATMKACALIGEWVNDSTPVVIDGENITYVAHIYKPQFYLYNDTARSWTKSDANVSSPQLSDETIFGWAGGFTPPPLPLTDVTPTEITMPRTLYLGRMVPVTVTIENNGMLDASPVEVRLDLKHETWANRTQDVASDVVSVNAGGNATVTLKWLAEESGEYEVRVILDPSNRLDETCETNNEIEIAARVIRGLIIDVPRDFRTIQEAVEDAAPDTVIYVHEGRYWDDTVHSTSDKDGIFITFTDKRNISLIGDGWATEVDDATINIHNSSGIVIDGFNMVRGGFGKGVHITIRNSDDVVINDCKLTQRHTGAVYLYNSSSCRISDCLLHYEARHYEPQPWGANWYALPSIYIAADSRDNLIVNNTLCQVPKGIRVEGTNNRIYHNNLYQTHFADGTTGSRRRIIASDSGEGNLWDYNYWARYCLYGSCTWTIPAYDDLICIDGVCYTHFEKGCSKSWCGHDVYGDAWAKSYDMLDADGNGIRDLPYSAPDPQYGDPVIDRHPLTEPYGVDMDARIAGVVVPNRVYANRTNAIFAIVKRTTRDVEPRTFEIAGFANGTKIGNETITLDGYLTAEELGHYAKLTWQPNATGSCRINATVTSEILDVSPSNNLMELDLDVLEPPFEPENLGSVQAPSGSKLSPAWCSIAICAMGTDPHSASWFDNDMKQYLLDQFEFGTASALRNAGGWAIWTMGIVASGEDPRNFGGINYLGMLESCYNGESMGNAETGDVAWDDAMALLAFDAAEVGDSGMIENVCNDLIGRQDTWDGSWFFKYHSEGGKASHTAIVVQALLVSGVSVNESSVQDGLKYLNKSINDDGSFPYRTTKYTGESQDVLATSHAIQAILAAGENPLDWNGSDTPDATPVDYLSNPSPVQEKHLFAVPGVFNTTNASNVSEFETALCNGTIPDMLEAMFESDDRPLTEGASVTNSTEEDDAWILTDAGDKYVLRRTDMNLTVYLREVTLSPDEQAARIPALLGEPYPVARLIMQEEPRVDLRPILIDAPYRIYNMTNCTINGIIRNSGGASPATLLANGVPVDDSTAKSVWAKGATEIDFKWKPEHSGEYNLTIASDYYNKVNETDETNNIRTIFVTVTNPDLEPEMRLRSNTVNVTNVIGATIYGTTDESFNVTFLVDGRVINTTRRSGIAGRTDLEFHWRPNETRYYNLAVFADSDTEVEESDETNNYLTKHVPAIKPELFVQSLDVPTIYSNATNPIYLDIGGVAGAFNVSLYVNGTNETNKTLVCKQMIESIWAEADLKTTLYWKPNRTGRYDMRVFVDSDNDEDERIETNNNKTVPVEVILPDLIPQEIVTPVHIYYNETNTINITITNAGDDFNVTLIADGGYVWNETVNGTANGTVSATNGTANGTEMTKTTVNATVIRKYTNVSFYGSTTLSFDWIPKRLGICNLTVLVDPDCDLYEANETNNNRTWDVRVVERVPIELLSPRGGEVWEGTENIEWNTTFWKNLTIDIDYSPNRGGRWSRIVSGTDDDGVHAWNTEDVSDGYDYLIRVMASGEDAYGEDISNKFTIYNTGSAESWEGFHANAGFSMSTAPNSAALADASIYIGANPSSSLCISDGKIFVYCDSGMVKCLDENNLGHIHWEVDVSDGDLDSWATPVYSKGMVYMVGSGSVGLCNDSDKDPIADDSIKAFVLSAIDAETGDVAKKYYYLVNKTDATGVPVNGGVLVAYGTQFFSTYDDGLYYRVTKDGEADTHPAPSSDQPGMSYCYGGERPSGWDWRFDVDGIAQSTPVAAFDSIYFGSYAGVGSSGGAIYRVNRGTGSEIWNQSLASGVCGSPTVVNGNVYLTTYGFYKSPSGTYVFDAKSGNPVWDHVWGGDGRPSDSTPACAPFDDGYVYVAGGGWSDSPYVVCFDDRDGSIVWDNDKSNFGHWINDLSQHDDKPFGIGHWTNSPVVSRDKKVFVGKPAEGGVTDYIGLFCLNATTGKERWHADYGGSTAAIANGRVYTTGGGHVYAYGTVGSIDLVPKEIAVPAYVYEKVETLINVTVENIGTEDAGDFDVSLGYEDVEIGTASVSSLARGEIANAAFRWTPPAAGNYRLQATVNSDMCVNENLLNNRMNKYITVLSTPQSDIAVTSLTHSSPVRTDESCTISATIINYGVPAGFDVSLTANGNPVGSPIHISDLSYMESKIVSFTWVPHVSKTYTLTVFADCHNTTIESDETNNTRSIDVTALFKPPPTPIPGLGGGDGGGSGSHAWRDGEGDGTDESEAITSGAETFVNETEPAEGEGKKAKGFPMGTKFLSGGGGGGAVSLAILLAVLLLMGLLIYGTRKERERYRKARR